MLTDLGVSLWSLVLFTGRGAHSSGRVYGHLCPCTPWHKALGDVTDHFKLRGWGFTPDATGIALRSGITVVTPAETIV